MVIGEYDLLMSMDGHRKGGQGNDLATGTGHCQSHCPSQIS